MAVRRHCDPRTSRSLVVFRASVWVTVLGTSSKFLTILAGMQGRVEYPEPTSAPACVAVPDIRPRASVREVQAK